MTRLAWPLAAALLAGCALGAPEDEDRIRRSDARADTVDTYVALEEDTEPPLDTSAPPDRDTSIADTKTEGDTGAADGGSKDSGSTIDMGAGDAPLVCSGEEKEPNDTEGTAIGLPEINDCDGSGSSFKGVLAGGSDVDVFKFRGNDTFGCVVDPTGSTSSKVRLCFFVKCSSITTDVVSCPVGERADWGTTGIKGCCADAAGKVEVNFTCPAVGASDSADVFMRVDAKDAMACVPYNVTYHF